MNEIMTQIATLADLSAKALTAIQIILEQHGQQISFLQWWNVGLTIGFLVLGYKVRTLSNKE
jgi:Na+/H+ antiporter NhaD/arsenite permease-like protein